MIINYGKQSSNVDQFNLELRLQYKHCEHAFDIGNSDYKHIQIYTQMWKKIQS
jgi:hypothetical protein